ncbi:MAG: AcrB/AcrD/AcrF family protein [Candidatus Wallbacteria bacterium HGW-Wallbacteria-1]|uniref:AcrB/AcrD/AcrF family protein n=1 Tax=Candidatus Wallbacteria bacterium HGW-Wallbacteria-1 TaxID=2013854 RepID=A0A2N1PR40_9BACT|nr:MAG: AcrB/AcrD/AcrF family protein [Candidatus Wallbacteria bacterium HGW-Wallbacteria-1]
MSLENNDSGTSLIGAIVHKFLTTQLSIIFIILAIGLGIGAVLVTPREEEPQIVVPMADVIVNCPGASPSEVEELVTTPLERLLWQIDGVEHVYSISSRDMAMATIRFYVGEDRERSYVKLRNKIESHIDTVPPIVKGWVVKPIEIDDVAVVTAVLTSSNNSPHELRRVAEEIKTRLDSIEDLSKSDIVGGYPREIRVILDLEKMAAKDLSILEVAQLLRSRNFSFTAGEITRNGQTLAVTAGPLLETPREIAGLPIISRRGGTIYLNEIAEIIDGPGEPSSYVWFGTGPAADLSHSAGKDVNKNTSPVAKSTERQSSPAVTLAFSKKKGTNAVKVADQVVNELERLKNSILPEGMAIHITRNYGQTANVKVNELLSSLVFAVLTVVALIAFAMGWREAFVVAMAVPISFALALFVNYITGFTINRVTLFALILSLGLVVDDPITNVDNIQRHIFRKRKKPMGATMDGVREVLPPVIMSTLTIIVSFLPMFFITGMMGPYMRPMAINVPLTVTFSTICALTFVPWLAYKLLRKKGMPENSTDMNSAQINTSEIDETDRNSESVDNTQIDVTPNWVRKSYRSVVAPLLDKPILSWIFIASIFVLLGFAGWLALSRRVPLKMLPFDNKNEFQITIDMPEGTPVEKTAEALKAVENVIAAVPEVTNFTAYAGLPSPVDFNGLVRHYYFRRYSHQGEIRVNLADKSRRSMQSHEIALRIRDKVVEAAAARGGIAKIVELPPGPPVISTLTCEIYGNEGTEYSEMIQASSNLQKLLSNQHGVVDIDDMSEAIHSELNFNLDRHLAALHGVANESAAMTLAGALGNMSVGILHLPGERNYLPIKLELSSADRRDSWRLAQTGVRAADGSLVELGTLGKFSVRNADQPLYHKDLQRVVYVTAELAGKTPVEVILDTQTALKKKPLSDKVRVEWAGEGEWQITLRVFRDLGLAFGVALMGIYLLLILETNSFFMPLIIMSAIPLTAIGIMPGFWLLNLLRAETIGGYENPVFFTATAMIGMIALGGIVVRNSIVLIEFIQDSLREGSTLREAILESGAVRFRPILLTAGTTALGAWPITLDPIFSGLAWALIFGLFASTAFTMLVVPVIYHKTFRKKYS